MAAAPVKTALLLVFACVTYPCVAQQCGSQTTCANNLCCSQYGYCGSTDSYCGKGCQSGPCTSGGTPSSPGGGVGSIVTSQVFDSLFPNRNSFYTYESFIAAANKYPSFGTTGDSSAKLREIAAYAAHVQQETAGLQYINEISPGSDYCDSSNTQYPCAAGQSYFGRGPLQLSWNYNYGAASSSVGSDILSQPGLVGSDPTISFEASFWFWTTASGSIPSCHDVIVGNWSPTQADSAAGRYPGFGLTIDIINGGIECGKATSQAQNRVTYYKQFCTQLGVDPGQNLDCTNMQHF
ncbi:hypothetical protein O6H91_13G026100 [Diphasiastrum complanatum]|uniref:Uncharacterized protein n=1 Tax=Diphasiastrum complanatum TaxID=34168 RepID=A0ACC2BT37_DIPCM|nr:hypothetical protein O6H91_13G026100 [Diphasiastrum complanatum]